MSSKTFLIDTNIWIHCFRRSRHPRTKKVQRFFRFLPKENKLVTTGIILAEFVQGIGRGKRDQAARKLLERYEYLSSTKEIYILAGELSANLTQRGFKTPLSDSLIAAVAIAYGVVLVTSDLHFKRFAGLKLKFIN